MAFLLDFVVRICRKLLAIAPIAAAAAVVFVIVWLALIVITPWLPESWQEALALLSEGDWKEGRERIRGMLESSALGLEVSFVALQALQVIVAPIPGQIAGLLAGYLFGFWHGLLLTMTGLSIGSFVAMSLGRLFGVQIVRRFVPADLMAKLDQLIAHGGVWNFFVIFLLPALPDDAVCFVAGMTRLRLWQLMLACLLGRLPGMAVLCFVGASAGEGESAGWVVFGIAMGISFLAWVYSEEIEARVFPSRADKVSEADGTSSEPSPRLPTEGGNSN